MFYSEICFVLNHFKINIVEKINKPFVASICAISALGGLLFGYDWVVIGGAKPFYEVFFGITDNPNLQGLAMSIAVAGCLLGAVFSGRLADKWGRKKLMIVSAFIFLLSAVATGAVSYFNSFLFARFLGGIAIGVSSGLSPMYIAEISPDSVRGRLVSVNQLTIVLGILGAQIVNLLIARPLPPDTLLPDIMSWNCQYGWRWMFWAEAFPAALFLVMAFFIPESPRWLLMAGNKRKAVEVLKRIGGSVYATDFVRDGAPSPEKERNVLGLLFSHKYISIMMLGLAIAVLQQWCGTNVIFNYAQEIFAGAGYELSDMLFNIVLTGITNLVFTFVAIFTVDRIGRRKLMLFGAGSLAAIYTILGTCYFFDIKGAVMVLLVVGAIACYAMTLGPVTWVLISELFPDRVRAVAVSVCTFALWTGCLTLTYTFPLLNNALGSYGTFWIYAAICAAGFIYFFKALPETKGRNINDII